MGQVKTMDTKKIQEVEIVKTKLNKISSEKGKQKFGVLRKLKKIRKG